MFSDSTINAAMEHARTEYPRESCGLVVDGAYVPRTNTAENPLDDFRISPQGFAAAARKGTVQAVIHSHPDKPEHPSRADMLGQIESGLAWGIVPVGKSTVRPPFFWGGSAPVPPLEGRSFRHGVTDCYAIVRDYYRLQCGVVLPDYARSGEWWEGDDDILMDNFRDAGFERTSSQPQPGDVFLMQVCSSKVNHCAVYLDGGLMLHHLSNRLSKVEPFNRWRKFVRMVVRRDEA